jgi:hypothetical protein
MLQTVLTITAAILSVIVQDLTVDTVDAAPASCP